MNGFALVMGILSNAENLMKLADAMRKNLKRSRELSPEQEWELDAKITALTGSPHWKPRE